MLYYNYTDELYHHGVKGQKWGVRRYQNKDGSLTDLGKRRLYPNGDSPDTNLYDDESRKAMLKESIENKTNTFYLGNVEEISEAGGFLKKQADVVRATYDKYEEAVMTEYPTLSKNDRFINEVKTRLGKEMTDLAKEDSEYRDLIEMEIEDHVFDCYRKYLSPEIKKLETDFEDGWDVYVDNVYTMADQIVGKYGDEKLTRKALLSTTSVRYKDAVFGTLRNLSDEDDWSYNAYKIAGYMQDDAYFNMVEDVRKRIMKEIND